MTPVIGKVSLFVIWGEHATVILSGIIPFASEWNDGVEEAAPSAVEGTPSLLKCSLRADSIPNTLRKGYETMEFGSVEVLRLHDCFAKRSSHSALDAN